MEFPVFPFCRLIYDDLFSENISLYSREIHFDAAVEWLKLAHDQGGGRGVSYGYSLKGGWRPPYRETTGYIIVTFLNLASLKNNKDYQLRAFQMCEWELDVQNADGSISNPHFYPDHGIVFDTGQVIFGLVKAFEASGDGRYLESARRAGQWLTDVSDGDDIWTRFTHNGIPHVYNSRTAWALLRLNQIDPKKDWIEVASANLNFAVSNQINGWFDQCAFKADVAPYTHTIAYAIRGLLESSIILENEDYFSTAEIVAKSCIAKMDSSGFIPGQIGTDGNVIDSYCCLTGNCQLSIIWSKLYRLTGNALYKDAALAALVYVMQRQIIASKNKNLRGGIKGSYPIWGSYSRVTFPNWATKFFIDAMIECWDWL